MQVLPILEDCDLMDVQGGGGPLGGGGMGGGFLDPSSFGSFFNENLNTNRASALSTLIGPLQL